MATRKKKNHQQQQRPWQPLRRSVDSDPEAYAKYGLTPPDRVYGNDLYSVFVRDIGHGAMHISFHRRNRAAVRDWRHFQAIKNEVAGPERMAVEVFPPESQLADQANEYHLWVFPEGWEDDYPFLFPVGRVADQEDNEREYGRSDARQRPWQPGIPTGKGVTQSTLPAE